MLQAQSWHVIFVFFFVIFATLQVQSWHAISFVDRQIGDHAALIIEDGDNLESKTSHDAQDNNQKSRPIVRRDTSLTLGGVANEHASKPSGHHQATASQSRSVGAAWHRLVRGTGPDDSLGLQVSWTPGPEPYTAGEDFYCRDDANWITYTGLVEYTMQTFESHNQVQTMFEYCKSYCKDSMPACTGFYFYEDGIVPGQGDYKCGHFTQDLSRGKMYVKRNTSDGRMCLRVGKNFQCSTSYNMVRPPITRLDLTLVTPTGKTYDEGLENCKFQCISGSTTCSAFWYQERNFDSWQCGLFGNPVDASDKTSDSASANVTKGCLCTAY